MSKTTSKRKRTSSTDKAVDEHEEKPKQMSPETKQMLTTTATVAALGVIGAVAISNPKVRELAATGMKTAHRVLTESVKTESSGHSHWDPDFEHDFQKHMKAMAAQEKHAEKARARHLKTEQRAQRKANEEFFKSIQRQQNEPIKEQQRESQRRKRIELARSHQGINRFGDLMISDLLLMT